MPSHLKRTEFISNNTRVNRKYEELFFPRVKRSIHSKTLNVINQIKSGGIDNAQRYLTTDLGNPQMTATIGLLYRTVGLRHARMNYSRLLPEIRRKHYSPHIETKGFGFNEAWTQIISDYLNKFLLDKITFEVSNTTRDNLLKILNQAINEGWSTDQTIEHLVNAPFERVQAARIVRTEVNRAGNVGARAQEQTSDYQQVKEWIAVTDDRTRGNPIKGQRDHADHWDLNRTKIDSDDFFKDPRNGDEMEFPGDPKASAASVVNCRCQVAFTFKRDANGALIPKRSISVIRPSQNRKPNIIPLRRVAV